MRVLVVTPPAPVVTLAEAKDHLRVTQDAEDALIEGFVAAATGHIDGPDGWLGRAIGRQTLEARFHCFETSGPMRLPYPPVVSITDVSWLDSSRVLHTGSPTDVTVIGADIYATDAPVWSGCYVGPDAVRIRYQAGYQPLPSAIRAAILLMVGDLYRNRSTVASGLSVTDVPMSTTVAALLQPFRVYA